MFDLKTIRVGVISDTHGSCPEAVFEVFEGVDEIVHAGDIGGEGILYDLQAIAPVTAVLGNTDHQGPTWPLPESATLETGGLRIFVTHIGGRGRGREELDADVVITGHTHRPEALFVEGRLHLNPGSTTRSRSSDAYGTVAVLTIREGVPTAEIATLLP